MTKAAVAVMVVAAASTTLFAQWPKHTAPGVPIGADGTPNLEAPAPRMPDGKPDLSGVWQIAANAARGRGRGAGRAGTPDVPAARANQAAGEPAAQGRAAAAPVP